jgi:hypothetical protein
MTLTDTIFIGASVVASLGGGAAIVFALSNWLGKVWADRLMQKERQDYALQLEHLRNSLRLASEEQLASLRSQLDIAKETRVREHLDRVTIYRTAVDLIAGLVAKIQMILLQRRGPLTPDELHEFEVQRLRVYAYLAMHAPQSVMDAHDAVSDLILAVVYDGQNTTWEHFRGLAIRFLNEVRQDVGIRPEPIVYRGTR